MTSDQNAIVDALKNVSNGRSLSTDEARDVMGVLLTGGATPAQIGALLMGMRVRRETTDEVVGFVSGMREAARKIAPRRDPIVDLCGTGGDGSGTFNISTAAALVVAAAGVAVAKHGNRAASSRCGSADVLEALGVPVDLPPQRAQKAIEEVGFAFLFARLYHPAMKHVAPIRGELGVRTVFNVMGPLSSPAGVERQLVGVFNDEARLQMADVFSKLGSRQVWVVHGEGGLDELSPSGTSRVSVVTTKGVEEMTVEPEDAGLERVDLASLQGGDASENAAIIERVLAGEKSPPRQAVLLNAAAALVISGTASDLREGAGLARDAIDGGVTAETLEKLRAFR